MPWWHSSSHAACPALPGELGTALNRWKSFSALKLHYVHQGLLFNRKNYGEFLAKSEIKRARILKVQAYLPPPTLSKTTVVSLLWEKANKLSKAILDSQRPYSDFTFHVQGCHNFATIFSWKKHEFVFKSILLELWLHFVPKDNLPFGPKYNSSDVFYL